MFPGARPGDRQPRPRLRTRSPGGQGHRGLRRAVSPPGGSPAPPAPRHAGTKCQRRKDRAEAHWCRGAPRVYTPCPPCLLWQIHRYPGTPAPRGLCTSSSLASARQEGCSGRRGRRARAAGAGVSSLEGAGRRHKLKASSLAQCPRGRGVRPARSGVIFFPSPVDVLEEGHGEGHAQNLKDTGKASDGGHGHPERVRQPPAGCRCWRSENDAEKGRPHVGTAAARTVRAGRHRASRPRNLPFQSAAVRAGPDPKWQPTGSWGRGGSGRTWTAPRLTSAGSWGTWRGV